MSFWFFGAKRKKRRERERKKITSHSFLNSYEHMRAYRRPAWSVSYHCNSCKSQLHEMFVLLRESDFFPRSSREKKRIQAGGPDKISPGTKQTITHEWARSRRGFAYLSKHNSIHFTAPFRTEGPKWYKVNEFRPRTPRSRRIKQPSVELENFDPPLFAFYQTTCYEERESMHQTGLHAIGK